VAAAAQAQAVSAWHDDIKLQGPPGGGCYRAAFPSTTWTAEACGPAPKLVSVRPPEAEGNGASRAATQAGVGPLNAGNGNDFAAETTNLTRAAVGTFPTVSGATSGTDGYSLQINTNIDDNPTTCDQFGYASCQTWEQFIYAGDSGSGAQAFIQNWFFAGDATEYSQKGCPSGWNAYGSQNACYRNSDSVSVDYVPMTDIGGVSLAGVANQDGRDVVTFTVNGTAHTVSQDASTLNIGNIWRRSEFNIFGNGAGAPVASFNAGTHVDVRVAVDDGSTNTPNCIQRGTTGEENNLTLGSCHASGGSSPAIQFDESN
jgi:hypothetical protein